MNLDAICVTCFSTVAIEKCNPIIYHEALKN